MGLIIWLVLVLLVAAAVLGVVKAVLALKIMQPLAEYTGVVYALIVLLIVLMIVSAFYGTGPLMRPPNWNG